jgi:predicted DNA-binding transcriptional regulator AlpA
MSKEGTMTEYLNLTDSAKFLDISRQYLYILIQRNEIQEPIEITRRVRVYEKKYLEAVKDGITKYKDGSALIQSESSTQV